jgi:hypothetical protein
LDCLGGVVVPYLVEEVRDGLPHPQQLLPQKDEKPAESTYCLIQSRYKLYISGERKREKEEVLKLKAVSELFKEV